MLSLPLCHEGEGIYSRLCSSLVASPSCFFKPSALPLGHDWEFWFLIWTGIAPFNSAVAFFF